MEERLMKVLRGVVYRLKMIGPTTEPYGLRNREVQKERDGMGWN